jgi:hypothetical protein
VVIFRTHVLPRTLATLMFQWEELAKVSGARAIAFGYGSLYNHDNPSNMRCEADPSGPALKFIASNIAAGEELTINYNAVGGGTEWGSDHWFERFGITRLRERVGVEKEPVDAVSLCRKSAERGAAEAQADLANMYLTGDGVERNPAEAAKWFQKAVAQGQADAAFQLRTMYWNGDGVERNRELAAKVWLLSAERGNVSAPARLAQYYFAAGVIPAEKRVLEDPASKAAYWATIATRVDPDSAARIESQKLADMILGVAPTLKPKVETMLAAAVTPGF